MHQVETDDINPLKAFLEQKLNNSDKFNNSTLVTEK